jgi:hypothetical protein
MRRLHTATEPAGGRAFARGFASAGTSTSVSAQRLAARKSRLSIMAEVSVRWLTIAPERGRQAELV